MRYKVRFYVYTHYDKDGQPFYVGKGSKNRFKLKCWSSRTKEWHEIAKDGFTQEIVQYFEEESEALDYEATLIRLLFEAGFNLVNVMHSGIPERHNMFGKTGEKHPSFGKKRPDASARIGEKNPMFGKTGEKSSRFKGYWFCGEHGKFASLILAAKEIGCSYVAVRRRCNSKNNKFKNWYFVPKKKRGLN